MRTIILTLISLLLGIVALTAQTSSLQVTVLDKQSETPLIGATCILVGIDPKIGAVTDVEGRITLRQVPTGRQALQVTYLGYEPQTIPNILVTAGKEVVLTIRMEESFNAMNEVVITAKTDKDKPNNELATISARQFNMEEVSRYSGGRSDVGRLAANFAGVAASNDARNDIIIRGNAPTGVLWRLEGIPIPNPNHFTTLGTTGGPVSALNPNLIGRSDFLTSAFPAEYGNATAGVFDINMRTGNRERHEYMFQVGAFTGLEAMLEGPLNRGKGSYLVSYRHSFVELATAAGIAPGTTATPRYKDLSFNVDFGQSKAGRFSIFGIGGHSAIDFLGAELDTTDLFANVTEDAYSRSKFGVFGVKHNMLLNDHAYIRTVASVSYSGTSYDAESLVLDNESGANLNLTDVLDGSTTYRVASYFNDKINKRITLRTGVLLQGQQLDTYVKTRDGIPDFDGDGLPDLITQRDFDGMFYTAEAYAQTQWRIVERLTLNVGLHGQYFDPSQAIEERDGGDFVIEPRVALNWQVAPRSTINLGYGLHNQTQPLPVFLFRERQPDGSTVATNANLGFTSSQHFVLGWDFKPATDWRVKAETYYQYLSKVPVDSEPGSFSMLNTGADFIFPERNRLNNTGTGTNLGVELTVEKFFSKGWYAMTTVSVFDSKYKGSDGIERSTAFDGGYVANVLAGKEFNLGGSGRRFLTFDTKFTYAGGRPYTPVDLTRSRQEGRQVLLEDMAFSEHMEDYFRWDVKVGMRVNSKKRKLSQSIFFDLANVTNRKNVFMQRYNTSTQNVGTVYQIGIFPDFLYRLEF
jgi:hypothetical protein